MEDVSLGLIIYIYICMYIQVLQVTGSGIGYNQSGTGIRTG